MFGFVQWDSPLDILLEILLSVAVIVAVVWLARLSNRSGVGAVRGARCARAPLPDESPPHERPGERRTRREQARIGAIVVLAILITLFAVLNGKQVEVNWIAGSGKAPLIIVIVISLLVGIVLTYITERRSGRRRR